MGGDAWVPICTVYMYSLLTELGRSTYSKYRVLSCKTPQGFRFHGSIITCTGLTQVVTVHIPYEYILLGTASTLYVYSATYRIVKAGFRYRSEHIFPWVCIHTIYIYDRDIYTLYSRSM